MHDYDNDDYDDDNNNDNNDNNDDDDDSVTVIVMNEIKLELHKFIPNITDKENLVVRIEDIQLKYMIGIIKSFGRKVGTVGIESNIWQHISEKFV